jgi:hypothetical protein
MLWLINQATAGSISTGQVTAPAAGEKKDERSEGALAKTGEASFSDFKIDTTA